MVLKVKNGSGKSRMILKTQNDSGKPRKILEHPEWFWCITRPVMDPGPGSRVQGGRRPTFGPFYSGPGSKNMQKLGIKTFFGGICVRKLPRIWICTFLSKAGSFWERQEAFWKGRKLSGKAGSFLEKQEAFLKSRKLSGKAGSFLENV